MGYRLSLLKLNAITHFLTVIIILSGLTAAESLLSVNSFIIGSVLLSKTEVCR